MGDLSANFSGSEFACRCCGELKIDKDLIYGLQTLRAMVWLPIQITSGFRCPGHNKEVGGAKHSQHLLGKAADIVIQGLDIWEMYDHAMAIALFRYGGVGVYPDQGFIHVDVRNQRTRWIRIGKRQRPFNDIQV